MGLKWWYSVAPNLVSLLAEWRVRSLPLKKSKNFLKKMVYKAIVVLGDPICRPYPRPTTQTRSQVILELEEGTHLLRRHPSQHPPPLPSWRRRRAGAERSSRGDSWLECCEKYKSFKLKIPQPDSKRRHSPDFWFWRIPIPIKNSLNSI